MRNVKCVLVLGGAEPPSFSWGQKNTAQCSLALLNKVNGEHQSWSVLFDITALSSALAVQAVHYGSALFFFYATMGRMNKVICMHAVCVKKSPLVTGLDFKQLNYIQKCMKNSKGCH